MQPSAPILYGPFDRPRSGLWLALVLVILAVGAAWYAADSQSLTCDRQAGSCELKAHTLFVPVGTDAFAMDGVKLEYEASGCTVFHLNPSHSVTLHDIGRGGHDEVSAFFGSSERQHLSVGTRPAAFSILLVMIPLVYCATLLFGMLRRPTDILLQKEGDSLVISERWWGRQLRTGRLSLDGVTAVRVVHEEAKDGAKAEVSLVTSDGDIRPLSKTPLNGDDVHDRCAAALAEVLGCRVVTVGYDRPEGD